MALFTMLKMGRRFTFYALLLILSVLLKHVESSKCGYDKTMKCGDMTSLSNSALRGFADLESKVDINTIFQNFNFERVVGTAGHAKARKYILKTFNDLGWSVETDRFNDSTPFGDKRFANVIASSNSSAPSRLVFACHYDSKYFSDITFIGATDSSIPCSILIHVAKTLNTKLKTVEDIGLDLIFFDGEEAFKDWTATDSIYGSRHLAKRWKEEQSDLLSAKHGGVCSRLDSINALVLLDLIGEKGLQFRNFYKENTCSTAIFDQLKSIEIRLRQLGKLDTNTTMFSSFVHYGGGYLEDDHIPFKNEGVNIVHLIAFPFPSVWHTRHDNAASLDWNTIHDMNKITRTFMGSYFNFGP